MKYGVIDVGSNSVRLMLSDGKSTFYKTVKTTQLAEKLVENNFLLPQAIERTVKAVYFFNEMAKKDGAEKVFVFATAGVRQAQNGDEFIESVKQVCGLSVDVVSGEQEAFYGISGALNGADGGVLDVGGASTELIAVHCGKVVYSKSIAIGAVRLKDVCGQDRLKAENFILEKIKEFGVLPKTNLIAIGGSATSIASMLQSLEPYDPNKVDGYVVGIDHLGELIDKLYSLSIEERKKLKGLQPERAEVIAGGCLIVYLIAKAVGVCEIMISEKDNLEGYLKVKMEKL